MQLEPPPPQIHDMPQMRRRMGYVGVILVGTGILLIATLAAWLALWAGGIRSAEEEVLPVPAAQESQP